MFSGVCNLLAKIMNNIIYVFYLFWVIISLLSVFLCDRKIVLSSELLVSLLLSLYLLIRIRKLNFKMQDKQNNDKEEEGLTHHDLLSLDEQKKWLRLKRENTKGVDLLLKDTDAYKLFKSYLGNPVKSSLTDNDWNRLQGALEEFVPIFKSLEDGTYQLTVDDIRLCILLRYGFKPSEISLIMNKSNATITRERRFLLKKLFNINGEATEFDVRIKDLL